MNLEEAILALRAELAILDEAIEALEALASPKSKRTREAIAILKRRRLQEPRSPLRLLDTPKVRISRTPPTSRDLS